MNKKTKNNLKKIKEIRNLSSFGIFLYVASIIACAVLFVIATFLSNGILRFLSRETFVIIVSIITPLISLFPLLLQFFFFLNKKKLKKKINALPKHVFEIVFPLDFVYRKKNYGITEVSRLTENALSNKLKIEAILKDEQQESVLDKVVRNKKYTNYMLTNLGYTKLQFLSDYEKIKNNKLSFVVFIPIFGICYFWYKILTKENLDNKDSIIGSSVKTHLLAVIPALAFFPLTLFLNVQAIVYYLFTRKKILKEFEEVLNFKEIWQWETFYCEGIHTRKLNTLDIEEKIVKSRIFATDIEWIDFLEQRNDGHNLMEIVRNVDMAIEKDDLQKLETIFFKNEYWIPFKGLWRYLKVLEEFRNSLGGVLFEKISFKYRSQFFLPYIILVLLATIFGCNLFIWFEINVIFKKTRKEIRETLDKSSVNS